MQVICLENEGGYEEYAYNITKYMKNVFDNVKSAYVCFYANNMVDARENAKQYFKEQDIKNNNYECDSDRVIIEFNSGKIVEFWNSEWGGIRALDKKFRITSDGLGENSED